MGRGHGDGLFYFDRYEPIEKISEIFKEELKGAIEMTNRRVVDPSENVTLNNQFERPMGVESIIRGIEIPIDSQVGLQDNEEFLLLRTTSHLEVLNTLMNETAALVQEDDVTFDQLQILKRKLSALENTVNQTHTSLVYCDIKPLLVDNALVLLHSTANSYLGGDTLLCADYQMKLNDFYGNTQQKWELIYKATRDGFV